VWLVEKKNGRTSQKFQDRLMEKKIQKVEERELKRKIDGWKKKIERLQKFEERGLKRKIDGWKKKIETSKNLRAGVENKNQWIDLKADLFRFLVLSLFYFFL
jgi:hypothetical protein